MRLYGYFRSSAAYRVRIALNLKGLAHEHAPIHLLRNEQASDEYRRMNPQALVPTLVDEGLRLVQSLAIIEYLEERHPQPPLLPATPAGRARVRALAQTIACDIHPLDNLRVLRYLQQHFGVTDEAKDAWYRHWIELGFAALEAELADSPYTGSFCHGDAPTLADVCLVPQVANARRAAIPLEPYPTLARIEARCAGEDAFLRAAPANQPDAA